MTSPDRRAALLEVLRGDPSATAVLTDFDGTLAAIVDDPAAARPVPGAAGAGGVLAALVRAGYRVGVVSGRPVAFLREHVAAPGVALSGLYGLEAVDPAGVTTVAPEAEAWRDAVETAAVDAEAALPGVLVERKGLSVTVHVRTVPEREAEVRSWAAAHAARTGLALHAAKRSYELRPPVRRDKGAVVAELSDGARAACFVGDDLGDLPAFDALDRAAAAGVDVVRVAVASAEVPAELLDRADLVLDGPDEVVRLLRELLEPAAR